MTSFLDAFVDVPPPGRSVIWSGAGVSVDAPSSLPAGVALTRAALDALFAPNTRETVEALYARLDRDPTVPRLETVLGVATTDDVHGLGGLRVLDGMRDARPNHLHRCLAAHLEAGGHQVTMNFDRCIERATGSAGARRRLLHLHGAIDDLESVRHGASVASIDRGFDDATVTALSDVLAGAELVVFVGYSGSDFFDVDPFLDRWADLGLAAGTTVLWLQHRASGEGVSVAVGRQTQGRQVSRLMAGGADVVEVGMPDGDGRGLAARTLEASSGRHGGR